MESKILQEWKSQGKIFPYRDNDIFYRDQGKGEVLVCIHGFPTSSWDWSRMWPDLIKRFRVIAVDMIGFGYSAKPVGYNYSCVDQANLHEVLLARLNIKKYHILAHDYGDSVAQELLARYKERRAKQQVGLEIGSICFLNGGLFPETHRPRPIQKLLLSPIGPLLSRLMNERLFRHSLSAVFAPGHQPSEEELSDFWNLVKNNNGKRVIHKLMQYIPERLTRRSRWVGVMVQTAIPARLINGRLDPISGKHMADRYRELVPEADVVSLEGVGHYPQVESPGKVLRAYLDFMRPILNT